MADFSLSLYHINHADSIRSVSVGVYIFVFELDKREVLTIARDARETPLQEGEK